ncbi:MAG: VacJ family lipoprotein [Neisseriaceae bacterium]|nr:VacJ family lipoprotein [Neisseriaceae bacterium]
MRKKTALWPISSLIFTLTIFYCPNFAWGEDNFNLQVPAARSAEMGKNPRDPYEKYNRKIHTFNNLVDDYALKPITKGYRTITPNFFRTGVNNFFNNLLDFYSLAHNVLRLNPQHVTEDVIRVFANTTFGLGGLIDVASLTGVPSNKTSLGDTFASWGWEETHYAVLPFFGPSTVRDGLGTGISLFRPDLEQYFYHGTQGAAAFYTLYLTNVRNSYWGSDELVKQAALDDYSYIRDFYLQNRDKKTGYSPKRISSTDEMASSPIDVEEEINIDDLVNDGDVSVSPQFDFTPLTSEENTPLSSEPL